MSDPNAQTRGSDERFDRVGETLSEAVTRAASVLEEELAGGVDSARRLTERLTADRRVDPAAFDEVVGRVRKDTHALIDMVVGQLPTPASGDDLTRRYAADAHDALDSLLDLARLTPEFANGLLDRVSASTRRAEGDPVAAPGAEPGAPTDGR
ncbi:hypothetical protein ACH4T9_28180 [Micromonospora sp. NPDC020750]|uniref:hypothetical protein n=1 Tax=unclassified Micromonospora TaxID=2617518 RepID=UPI00379DF4DB